MDLLYAETGWESKLGGERSQVLFLHPFPPLCLCNVLRCENDPVRFFGDCLLALTYAFA